MSAGTQPNAAKQTVTNAMQQAHSEIHAHARFLGQHHTQTKMPMEGPGETPDGPADAADDRAIGDTY